MLRRLQLLVRGGRRGRGTGEHMRRRQLSKCPRHLVPTQSCCSALSGLRVRMRVHCP